MWPSFFSFKIHPERMGIRNYLWRRVSISIVIYARFSIAIISRKYFVIFCQVVNSTLTKLAMMNAKPRQTINLYLDLIKKSAIKFRFVCLCFYIPLEKCSLKWRIHHYLQILTYARHSWPLSSEGSLLCHGTSVYNGHL